MSRSYQYNFSSVIPSMYDVQSRERKAKTMIAVLSDYFGVPRLADLTVLDVGSSTGIIDHYLSQHVKRMTGIDIDTQAVLHAQKNFQRENLEFAEGDAMRLAFADDSFDVVICSHIYEHVPDSTKLMSEIRRVLKPSGVCFFSAGNRIIVMEPHYRLPLLSVLPKPLAHLYMKLTGKGSRYYEEHLTYWGLKRLTQAFIHHDYTQRMVLQPEKFGIDYMVGSRGLRRFLVRLVAQRFYCFFPTYIWLLEKSSE